MNVSLGILLSMLNEQNTGSSIREITGIEYDVAAEIPLRVSYLDKGGNYHYIGFNSEHKLVTFE